MYTLSTQKNTKLTLLGSTMAHLIRHGCNVVRQKVSCELSAPKKPWGYCRWEDNIRMDLRKIRFNEMDWIELAQDKDMMMTRKASSKVHQEDIVTIPLAGFCEICQDGYTDQRAHIKSERHTQFVNNDHNFLALDSLISGRSSMDTFLKTNGASELTQCSMLGSTRRSLRSVVRVSPPPQHATRSSTLNMRQTLEEKHLAKVVHQSESLEVRTVD
uniref:DBF4-type domain-containing protein n=1 Tax=Timema cristinae TaxID=61476 RepID=A0A7R9GQN1_TIMCR|nr:unnamed protein product [Timema cristinae]